MHRAAVTSGVASRGARIRWVASPVCVQGMSRRSATHMRSRRPRRCSPRQSCCCAKGPSFCLQDRQAGRRI
eukprot:5828241-Prymnesium_polylepis.2